MKRIIVSVTNDLATDQRVHKVCTTLTEQGFSILLIGRKLKSSTKLNRTYETKRISLIFNKGFLFYAEYNLRLFLKLLFIKKDILVANDLDTLLPNFLISKILNKNLVYDSHELYTEVPELVNRPKIQNVWLKLEKFIVPKLTNCITVCDSIAAYYYKKYGVHFEVVRNVPQQIVTKKTTLPFDTSNKKIILYQGALNMGRGLELMIRTMVHLENIILLIIGTGNLENELKQLVSENALQTKVIFLGSISPKKLKAITPNADLGISIEEDLGLNYRYALPNKIFDYIQAEVPCLVSDLPEMKKIILENEIGSIIEKRNPKDLALQIENIFNNTNTYNNWKHNIKNTTQYNWATEKEKIITIFNSIG